MASGVGTLAACQLLGIGRKTGYRWRAENGGLPPARLAESSRSSRFLSLLQRQRIATLRARGLGLRETARRLGRSPLTVSRELRRNLRPHDRGLYDGDLAHARARDRARRPRRPLLSREPELRRIVQDQLELEWSPAQIAAHLRETYPDRPAWQLCHETIYQGLYHGGRGGLSRTLIRELRTGRPLRKRRRNPAVRTPRFLAPGR
jgi:transposase, IS30 family